MLPFPTNACAEAKSAYSSSGTVSAQKEKRMNELQQRQQMYREGNHTIVEDIRDPADVTLLLHP